MLLSCQLVREGFHVTSLEPTAEGFGHFSRMQQLVLQEAAEAGCVPSVLDCHVEALDLAGAFDFAFSINVMEHVGDVAQALSRVTTSLRPGGAYRFTCPNYLFPYEPHFNIPTVWSKRWTKRMLHRVIDARPGIPDPAGLWESLNWIDPLRVRRACRALPGIHLQFRADLLVDMFERAVDDPAFAARRSGLAGRLAAALVRLGLHRPLARLPAVLQPMMDCRMVKAAGATV
jgi:SAM-dependent methyltransferase